MSVQKLPTTEETKQWLKDTDKTRAWLAEEIGAEKRSLDNWFTAGRLPEWAARHIHRIMQEHKQPRLSFTENEWDCIESARKLAGYTDRHSFYVDAINAWAEKITAAQTNITPFPASADTDTARVAEPAPEYKVNPKP